MPAVFRAQRTAGLAVYGDGLGSAPAAYAGTVAALTFASTLSVVAGAYTAPAVSAEPVTLAEAKLAARMDSSDAELNPVVLGYITAARQIAEQETGRCYVQRVNRYTFSDWPAASHVMYTHAPTGVAVQWWDGTAWQTLAPEAMAWAEVNNGTSIAPALDTSWPTLGRVAIGPRVRVDITAGSATPATTTPECVKTYIKALVGFWIDNPTAGASASVREAPYLARLLDPERLWGA